MANAGGNHPGMQPTPGVPMAPGSQMLAQQGMQNQTQMSGTMSLLQLQLVRDMRLRCPSIEIAMTPGQAVRHASKRLAIWAIVRAMQSWPDLRYDCWGVLFSYIWMFVAGHMQGHSATLSNQNISQLQNSHLNHTASPLPGQAQATPTQLQVLTLPTLLNLTSVWLDSKLPHNLENLLYMCELYTYLFQYCTVL